MDTTDSAYGDKLVRLDTFDTAVAVDPSAEDDAKRRFMTLILQTAHRNNGNIGHVLRATNTSGEVFAVKLLKDNAILSGQAPDRSAEQSAAHLANTAALFEEYRHLCTVSHLRGFPRVYGYGSCEDDPLILMEWVEGTSLKQALPLLPHDASGGLTTQMVAAVGNAVLRALLMTQGLVNPVVHRDLSPANIMFRTTSRTLEQQIADCSFDPCLIDMGSASPDNGLLTRFIIVAAAFVVVAVLFAVCSVSWSREADPDPAAPAPWLGIGLLPVMLSGLLVFAASFVMQLIF